MRNNNMMTSEPFWTLYTGNGLAIASPADINHPTTYVLLEQEDACEPELNFVRRFIQPGMAVVDAKVELGLRTLNIARQLGQAGKLVVLNEHELFSVSARINSLEPVLARQPIQLPVDFIHLADVDFTTLPTMNYLEALVLFTASGEQENTLRSMGFDFYQLVPGLNALIPLSGILPEGGYCFACRAGRAHQLHHQGLMIKPVDSFASRVSTRNWQFGLTDLPYAQSLLPEWQRHWQTQVTDQDYLRALNYYLSSRDSLLAIHERYALLARSYENFRRIWTQERSFPAALGVLRSLSDLGHSGEISRVIDEVYQALGQGLAVRIDLPFIPPLGIQDNRPLATPPDYGKWLSAALMETQELHSELTTHANPEWHLALLTEICQLPDHSLAMDRRLALCRLRIGHSADLAEKHPLLGTSSPNHLIWRKLSGIQSTGAAEPALINSPPWLPMGSSFIDWTNSSRTDLMIHFCCERCSFFLSLPVSVQALESRDIQCPNCGHVGQMDENKIISIIRSDYLGLLEYTEHLLTTQAPIAQDFFVKLINHGFLLENITPVRFVRLRAERIGHFAGNTEIGLQELIHIDNKKNPILIAFPVTQISNTFMLEMWARIMCVSGLGHLLFEFCKDNSLYKDMALDLYGGNPKNSEGTDRHGLLLKTPALLSFTQQDHARAVAHLTRMGITGQQPYVCFLGRDSRYLKEELPGIDWSYHDYRNMAIEDFLPAMNALADQGVYSLRMGSAVAAPLNTERKEIIDYASRFRDEFMDVYLSGNCKLFVSTGTGIDAIPAIFRNMICFVNLLPVGSPSVTTLPCICIHKKLWFNQEKRFLSYREQFESGAASFGMSQQYQQAGITVIDNTPEEIKSAVMEAWKRAQGIRQESDEDEYIHQQAIGIFQKFNSQSYPINFRIGHEFLKQNYYLLD